MKEMQTHNAFYQLFPFKQPAKEVVLAKKFNKKYGKKTNQKGCKAKG